MSLFVGDQRPDDHDRPDAVPHDLPCPVCRHAHGVYPCTWCGCVSRWLPGDLSTYIEES